MKYTLIIALAVVFTANIPTPAQAKSTEFVKATTTMQLNRHNDK